MTDTKAKPVRKSEITLVSPKRAADTAAFITNGADAYPDDSFYGAYSAQAADGSVSTIEPTFKPGTLHALTSTNNILAQCVEIMEVNIDGTGHTIELIEGAKENEAEKLMLENFFNEPYPNKSMVAIRRELRADLEVTGNGYLEVIRNMEKSVVLMNNLPALDTRLVRYDDPVLVSRTVVRNGKDLQVRVRARERRFVQMINGKKVYFKEFGASRDLDRETGKWAKEGEKVAFDKQASEVLHFTLTKEPKTPYGSPRWINQLPSVLGSRKAEEFNLDFFDAGGLPPVLVLVQGGYLGEGVKDELKAHLEGSKHRAAIVEAIAASGSLDSSGSVKVTVERFGAERQQDAMFQTYDKNTEDHVRASFRLPPLFTGRAQDYNFATALTGYMTAEAQVFGPERFEFDERMRWLAKELGAKSYHFKSKPMTLTNVDNQLKAIEMMTTAKLVEPEGLVTSLNTLTGLSLTYQEPPPPDEKPSPNIDPMTNLPYKEPVQPIHPNDPRLVKATGKLAAPESTTSNPVTKSDDITRIIGMVDRWANVLGLSGPCTLTDDQVTILKHEMDGLLQEDRKTFNEILASKSLVNVQADLEGLAELCGHAQH